MITDFEVGRDWLAIMPKMGQQTVSYFNKELLKFCSSTWDGGVNCKFDDCGEDGRGEETHPKQWGSRYCAASGFLVGRMKEICDHNHFRHASVLRASKTED